jgi:hypothetical protein
LFSIVFIVSSDIDVIKSVAFDVPKDREKLPAIEDKVVDLVRVMVTVEFPWLVCLLSQVSELFKSSGNKNGLAVKSGTALGPKRERNVIDHEKIPE